VKPEDEEKFHITYDFVMSNFKYQKFLEVDGNKVERITDGLEEKFLVHRQYKKAECFTSLCQQFLELQAFEYKDKAKQPIKI